MNLISLSAPILIAIAVGGCGLDALEGRPSAFKAETERRAALTLPVTLAAVSRAVVAPVVEPVVVAAVEVCVPVFRITVCPEVLP